MNRLKNLNEQQTHIQNKHMKQIQIEMELNSQAVFASNQMVALNEIQKKKFAKLSKNLSDI